RPSAIASSSNTTLREGGTVSARALRRLNVMYFRAAYNLPITLGLEHGVFARHGLDLEITYTRGSRMSGAALVSAAQALGALALHDGVYAVEKRNADLFAFMGYNSGTMQLMARPASSRPAISPARLSASTISTPASPSWRTRSCRGWGFGAMHT